MRLLIILLVFSNSYLSLCFHINSQKAIRKTQHEFLKLTASSDKVEYVTRPVKLNRIASLTKNIVMLGSLALLQGILSAKIINEYKLILGRMSKLNIMFPQIFFMGAIYTAQYAIIQPDLFQGPATIVSLDSKTFSLRRQISRLISVFFSIGAGGSPLGVTGFLILHLKYSNIQH